MKPTEKAPIIEALLEKMTGRSTSIAANRCVATPIGCGQPAAVFRDLLSAREYRISGLCQDCQDKIFGVEDNVDD